MGFGLTLSYGIWFDPVKWETTKNYNKSAEFSFALKGKDAYAFMICEGIKIPYDTVLNLIINDFEEVSEEFSVLAIEDIIVMD